MMGKWHYNIPTHDQAWLWTKLIPWPYLKLVSKKMTVRKYSFFQISGSFFRNFFKNFLTF